MSDIDRLLAVMARLRDPERGCPWDLEQTFETIAPHTVEEAYEVLDAVRRGDMAALVDELGDLLFQIVFYARLGREAGVFDFADVARAVSDKMVRRHPHVFGDEPTPDAAARTRRWEAIKAAERAARNDGGALDGVVRALPALSRALKLQRRAARVGFDWRSVEPVLDKLREELAELEVELDRPDAPPARVADEIGDLLFSCVNLARHVGADPEAALREANDKFERRFRRVEALLAAAGRTPEQASPDEMDRLWERAKSGEREGPRSEAAGGRSVSRSQADE